jgi:enoyl-CoA hydratase
MSFRFLKTRQVENTRWIEFHNPPANIVTTDVMAELLRAFREADADPAVRVVVFTGGLPGRYVFHFSIPEILHAPRDNRKLLLNWIFKWQFTAAIGRWQMALSLRMMRNFRFYESMMLGLARMLRKQAPTFYLFFQTMATTYAIENCRKITIAAINGTCNGSGTEVAACYDFRFMIGDSGYSICHTEALIGIIPGGGGPQRVTRLVGRAKAIELILGCAIWTPEEAKQAGLITDHFPKAVFVEKVQAFANLMSRRSLIAFTAGRKAITRGMGVELSRGLAFDTEANVLCCDDPSSQAALREYAGYLQKNVEEKPDAPATMEEALEVLESDRITRFYSKSRGG